MYNPAALPRISFVIDNLIYNGQDGSLGYRKGQKYSLRIGIDNYNRIVICRTDFSGINIYDSQKIFNVLWKGQKNIVRKLKLMKVEIS